MALAKVRTRLANKIAKMQFLRNEGLCKYKLFEVNVFPEINWRGKVKNQRSLKKKKKQDTSYRCKRSNQVTYPGTLPNMYLQTMWAKSSVMPSAP